MADFTRPSTRTLSASFGPTSEASMLYYMLPNVVQSRIPRLPSIRRSASMYGLPTRRRSSSSTRQTSGAATPDLDDKQAMVLTGHEGLNGRSAAYSIGSESVSSEEDGLSMRVNPEMRKRTMRRRGPDPIETESGIAWKFANQGFSLLSSSLDESLNFETSKDPRHQNPVFARQLYIHSLTYLLRSLPTDITTAERISIRSSLPETIIISPLESSYQNQSEASTRTTSQPSLLHRTLAGTIVQLFILFQLLLPYLKFYINLAYRYDQEHKISDRIASQGIELMDRLRKRGIALGFKLWELGDGQVAETAKWVLQGVVGGVHEGLGRGLVILNSS